MLYCERCRAGIANTGECPNCSNKKLREIRENDPVFLLKAGPPWNGMAEDILKNNDIPFQRTANIVSFYPTDAATYNCRYYVPFGALKKARRITADLADVEGVEYGEYQEYQD